VEALIGNDLFDALAIGHHGLDLFGGLNQRLDACGGIALIRPLHCHRYNRASVQVDGVLGFVRQMRPSVFHLGERRRSVHRSCKSSRVGSGPEERKCISLIADLSLPNPRA
jgi:hypothetical protein